MGSYYYAAASLPFLEFTSDVLPAAEDFLSLCYHCGGDAELKIIASASLEPNDVSAHPLIRSFWRWEIGLRNELTRQRSLLLNRESVIHSDDTGSDGTAIAGLSEMLKALMQSSNPLEADEELDRLRWQYLDELECGHVFDIQQMIVYYLRLQILLRRRSLVVDEGRRLYQQYVADINQQEVRA